MPSDPRVLGEQFFPTFVTFVSLADVAPALLIIFFVCRAKSALW